jgi:hypothetical protein
VSEKKGFFSRLFGRQNKAGYNDILKELNIRMLKDERFALRVEDYQEFCNCIKDYSTVKLPKNKEDSGQASDKTRHLTPEEIVSITSDQASDINNKLQQSAIPYGRAGDSNKQWYSDMISNWNTLYSTFMLPFISTTQATIERLNTRGSYKPDTQKKQAVQKLRYFFESIYLDCALTVGALSWFGEDVTPQWIGAIQTIPVLQQGGGQVITGSGGRNSEGDGQMRKPERPGYPEKITNEV